MANVTISPYMSLTLPIPGLETGPQYAFDQNTSFSIIDQHTHIPGQGLPIPSAAININADLPMNSFNLTLTRSSRYINNNSPLSGGADLTCVYVSGGELYYNDVSGNQVQLTLGGAVDTSGSGNITGMGGTGASVVYTNVNKTFSFYQSANRPTALSIGSIAIGNNLVAPNQVTLITSTTIPAPYTLTFPESLPGQTAFVATALTGVQVNIPPDGVTTSIVANQLVANIPPGLMMAYVGVSAPLGWLLCNGSAVSRTTYANLFSIIGTAYGVGDTVTTFNLPDCRGQFLRGVSGASGNDPDAAGRTAVNGGASGNNVGSNQTGAFTSHTHTAIVTDPSHNHSQNSHNHTQDAHNHQINVAGGGGPNGFSRVNSPGGGAGGNDITLSTTATNQPQTASNNANTTGITVANNSTGGNETRPLNLYVNYLIKV